MKPFFKTVIITSLIAGTLDIIAAFIQVYMSTQHFFKKMFNYIAGGALGLDKSMTGGWGTIFLGIFFHYFIAFAFTLFFFLLYPKLKPAWRNQYLTGFLYGIFIWIVMNIIVLPLTRLPSAPFKLESAIISALIIIFMVGLPISVSAHKYFKEKV